MSSRSEQRVRISDSEWQVMGVVWERSPIASAEVVQALTSQTGWHPRTIRTLLDRLVKKRALRATRESKRNLYEPLVSREACQRHESRSILERFGGEMLLHLVRESDLSPEEIQELKRLLLEKER